MNPPFVSLLSATGISFLSMVDLAMADPVGSTANVADNVIMEAGEIDSSRVPTGSYVVVIHGKGERHPVSGEWEQLVTSRGYVYAVDAEVLTLFRGWDGEPEWIAVDRIQTLVQFGSRFRKEVEGANETEPFPPSVASGDSIQAEGKVEAAERFNVTTSSPEASRDSTSIPGLVVRKLISGIFMGDPFIQGSYLQKVWKKRKGDPNLPL